MPSATVTWTGGEMFRAVGASGVPVVLDSDRQTNAGPGPMELLLVALGGCSGTDVVDILRKKRQQLTALQIRLEGERAEEPPRVWARIKIHFQVTGKGIDPRGVEHAIELSRTKYCSVAATLAHTAEIEWSHSIREG